MNEATRVFKFLFQTSNPSTSTLLPIPSLSLVSLGLVKLQIAQTFQLTLATPNLTNPQSFPFPSLHGPVDYQIHQTSMHLPVTSL